MLKFFKTKYPRSSTRQFLLKSLYQDDEGWQTGVLICLLLKETLLLEIIQEINADIPLF